MHPDKEYCAICDGVSDLDCSLQGGLLCKPGRKAEPQYIDFDTCAKAAGYVKLQPGQVVVDAATLKDAFADCGIEFWVEVEDGLSFDAVIESAIDKLKEARDE